MGFSKNKLGLIDKVNMANIYIFGTNISIPSFNSYQLNWTDFMSVSKTKSNYFFFQFFVCFVNVCHKINNISFPLIILSPQLKCSQISLRSSLYILRLLFHLERKHFQASNKKKTVFKTFNILRLKLLYNLYQCV